MLICINFSYLFFFFFFSCCRVTFEMITKAVHTRKCCVLKVQNDNGFETEIVFKLSTPSAANALYRCLTEMHSFYLCDTVHNEVSMQFSRDLKGTLVSIFNENTTLGKSDIIVL